MKLKSISVSNYRSIEEVSFIIGPTENGSFTYGLIGVNEAGKSTILKALALKDDLITLNPKDYRDKSKKIEILYSYKLDDATIHECRSLLGTMQLSREIADNALDEAELSIFFEHSNPLLKTTNLVLPKLFIDEKQAVEELLKQVILDRAHKSIFWTAEDRYLISQPINLELFAASPDAVSVPLKNCFKLADIDDIKGRVTSLQNDSTEIEYLQRELGESVTKHIKTVWPGHPIEITFVINNGMIHFHVKDEDTKGRAKTADQRSDGFRQFVSFLLTISAQNKNEELSDTILLLDEPETHLHPQAQEELLKELIKITNNERNNIAWFATHSNYMIDKQDLSRHYRVKKDGDKTKISRFEKGVSTYASVTYEVFNIPSTDYHNDLYSMLHERYQDNAPEGVENKRWQISDFDEKYLAGEMKQERSRPWKKLPNSATLHTYIRNCIHHPDNGGSYSTDELKQSIDLLRSFIE